METIELTKLLVKHIIERFFNEDDAYRTKVDNWFQDNQYRFEESEDLTKLIRQLSDKELEELLLLI